RLGGAERFGVLHFHLALTQRRDPDTSERASATFTVTVKDADASKVGRAFSSAITELALASYPGFYSTDPPGDASAYGVYWPTLVPADAVDHVAVLPDGRSVPIKPLAVVTRSPVKVTPAGVPLPPAGLTRRAPLGRVAGARSGDK